MTDQAAFGEALYEYSRDKRQGVERLHRALRAARTIIEANDLPAYVRAYAIVADAAIDLLRIIDPPPSLAETLTDI